MHNCRGSGRHRIGRGEGCALIRVSLAALFVLAAFSPAHSQTPQEHEQHHPAAPSATPKAPAQPQPGMPSSSPEPSPQGGGMGGMMGAPPPKALYPSLMDLPELTPERREEFERLAGERMIAGGALMSAAFERLTAATQSGDAAAMQEANAQVREGLAQFESGLALRRAITEGRAPRDVAIAWFRREMNLLPVGEGEPPHGYFGLSWFHYFTMFILSAFAVTMVGMYFHKMRRAEVLVARLAGGANGVAAAFESPFTPVSSAVPAPSLATAVAAQATDREPAVHPDVPSKQNSWTGLLRVARIFQETPNVKSFRLTDPRDGMLPFTYLPGQFLTVTVAPAGSSVKRSYTIASSPTQRAFCEVTVKREEQGTVSGFLHDRVKEGDTLQISAPSGRFTFTGEEASSVVLIAGGVGVTPVMSAIRYLTGRSWSGDIFFFYAVRGEADVIFREELEYLQRRYPNLHVVIVAEQVESPTWRYATGRITRKLLEASVPEIASRRVHICGPPPMMDAVKSLLADLGVPAGQVRTEIFIGKERPPTPFEAIPAAQVNIAVVTFAKSRRTAMLPPTKTVLEGSEDVGVNIEYSCRVGTCGVCRTKLLSGDVTMEVEDGLEPGDKSNNIILACQAKATADIAVDA